MKHAVRKALDELTEVFEKGYIDAGDADKVTNATRNLIAQAKKGDPDAIEVLNFIQSVKSGNEKSHSADNEVDKK